jgi:hypothetical protein
VSATTIDGQTTKGLASDGSAFALRGGIYLFTAHINNGSGLTAGLQMLSADGSSYVAVSSTYAHVDGYDTLYLPQGRYRFGVSGTPGASETFDCAVWRAPASSATPDPRGAVPDRVSR